MIFYISFRMVTNLQATVEKLCGENSCLREEVIYNYMTEFDEFRYL